MCLILNTRFVKEIENVFGGQLILFFILNACVMCTTLLQFVSVSEIFNKKMDTYFFLFK